MLTLQLLADGIRQVSQNYIEEPGLDGNYPAMVVQYLISSFLISMGGRAEDFGFYLDPDSVGYTGWITIKGETLFFGPTKAIVLKSTPGDAQGELSPYGRLP